MGSCQSKTEEELEREAQNRKIEEEMERQKKADTNKVKLLLLGAGESGKSTIFKQMKVIYGKTFTPEERQQQVATIHSNIVAAMKCLCDHVSVFNFTSLLENEKEYEMVKGLDEYAFIDIAIGNAIGALWKDPAINEVWKKRSEFQVIESTQYYFNNIDTIKLPDWLPDKDDILYSRVRTSGIITEAYDINDSIFEMYDVGGQRNERKKWIHCFQDVTAVIFVAAISEYDQKLFEDATANRMVEALDLFEEICNQKWFAGSSIILFLNKKDLFQEKIKTVPIQDTPTFSDYTGALGDYDAGVEYFMSKFKGRVAGDKEIYHHVTCATDTRNVQVVFDSCKDIIIKANLKDSGFV